MTQKTVLITGGNKGIGLDVTDLFYQSGFSVIVLARDFSTFPRDRYPDVHLVEFDLRRVDTIPQIIATLPPVDILINNAGIMNAIAPQAYDADRIDEIMKINLQAPVTLINEVSKGMVKSGSGRIVNVASVAGEMGHPDVWYGISKAGLINATKSFSKLLGPCGIIINVVAPGPVETDMLNTIPGPRKEELRSLTIKKRFAYSEEVASTIFWLGTQSTGYINGTCIDINNGSFMR